MFPEVQTEYPALSGRKNAISFRKLVESSGLYEKRSLCPDFIATFVAGLLSPILAHRAYASANERESTGGRLASDHNYQALRAAAALARPPRNGLGIIREGLSVANAPDVTGPSAPRVPNRTQSFNPLKRCIPWQNHDVSKSPHGVAGEFKILGRLIENELRRAGHICFVRLQRTSYRHTT